MIIQCSGCGRQVKSDAAIPVEHGEELLYFCSEPCREYGVDLDLLATAADDECDAPMSYPEPPRDG